MVKLDKTAKLQLLLCEMKLEKRHVDTDLFRLVNQSKTIDFFRAKQLSGKKSGLAKQISSVESRIDPNIIA